MTIDEPPAWTLFRLGPFYLERTDLVHGDGTPYMQRWLLRHPWGNIRLHHILSSDTDRAPHDHPFDFWSLILWGSYVEYRPLGSGTETWLRRRYRAGQVNRCRAEDLHRLELHHGPVWDPGVLRQEASGVGLPDR